MNYSSVFTAKDGICKHFDYLRTSINFFAPKFCVEKKPLPEDFKVEKIDRYLIRKLSVD